MSSSIPLTMVLIQGICSTPQAFDPLIQELSTSHKIENVKTIKLPSAEAFNGNADLTPNPLEADIKAIRTMLKDLVETQNHDVLLVAHSYGGTPSLHSTKGLWKHTRHSSGVTKALLLCSSLSLPGQAVGGVRMAWAQANPNGGINDSQGVNIEEHNGISYIVPTPDLWPTWFNDLSESEQRTWGEKCLVPSALGAPISPVPESGDSVSDPKDWKIAYLLCEEIDNAMPAKFQESLIEQGRNAGAVLDVKRIKSGHFVQISHAREVAGWIMQNAKA